MLFPRGESPGPVVPDLLFFAAIRSINGIFKILFYRFLSGGHGGRTILKQARPVEKQWGTGPLSPAFGPPQAVVYCFFSWSSISRSA
jgi:hypothetical protein